MIGIKRLTFQIDSYSIRALAQLPQLGFFMLKKKYEDGMASSIKLLLALWIVNFSVLLNATPSMINFSMSFNTAGLKTEPKEILSVIPVNKDNQSILQNLSLPYKAEFSPITGSKPLADGASVTYFYENKKHQRYLLYYKDMPIGFAIIGKENDINDIAEFYITPSFRKKGFGRYLAQFIFKEHPGKWQVRQLVHTKNSITFWRKVITRLTNGHYHETIIPDPDWGEVLCQTFEYHL